MSRGFLQADRAAAVRGAARGWRRAGLIDEAALAAVEGLFPDDRVRVGPAFRALLFGFTLLAVYAGVGFVALVGRVRGGGLALLGLIAGGALAALTEHQIGTLRRRQGGTEAATSLAAAGCLLGALTWGLPPHLDWREGFAAISLAAAALLGTAAWRWGYPLYAGAGAAALLLAAAPLPAGRLLWIALPLAAAPLLVRLSEAPRLPPADRDSCTAALIVALAALYTAVNLRSWEEQLIEAAFGRGGEPRPHGGLAWWAAAAATALVPAVLVALGLRRRRYPLLVAGAGSGVASLVTLRYYVHFAPLWVVLTLSGLLLAALALVLARYLESGPGGERHGITAAPLFADPARGRFLEAGAAALTLAPAARSLSEEPTFSGGGGRSGGGGASGEF
ncbi:MAG TPA: hypothetical protein VHR45_14200 [Thermoanaerobaculia bacterium]|nr:hypothetical protein [Thermoanaerobaculia bacterium]